MLWEPKDREVSESPGHSAMTLSCTKRTCLACFHGACDRENRNRGLEARAPPFTLQNQMRAIYQNVLPLLPVQCGEFGPVWETLQMYSRTGRMEQRRRVAAIVCIRSLEHSELTESTTTENVSRIGLRAIVKRQWLEMEPVVVESPPGRLCSRGWVVYCQPVENGGFAVGLRLLVPQSDWTHKAETDPR